MQSVTYQRCINHPVREAVARCPECHGFFCRECITEHDDRVICANCLKQITHVTVNTGPRFASLARLAYCALGLLISWLFFYQVGRALLLIPTSFHDGTLWQSDQQ
jgi:hypothetical protein